ncbi:receptor-type tyrosine-protein phosphatase eta-like isoform X2 [Pseudoliparis swirei]|uniref:receptor-type tyrosine-protein phosphatase eta-like isoform X2 n=1 Tax=Pseudoliparis swirei TaxID=2059687 RepID=UPI0024BE61CD|nr:receptor-type tyrosine-protein phosphatase eta-like isoform X2 [Pseudoliparis swirei]
MKLLSSVSLWTLAVFSAVLEISQAECDISGCEGNDTETSTTTSIVNCTISNGSSASENGCFNCCKEATTKPPAVMNLTATNITASSISLEWSKPEGNISLYRVRWNDGGFNETTGASLTITGLTPGVNISISVSAVAGDTLSEGETATLSVYTKPEVVRNITVTQITTSSVSLKWTKPEGNSSFYRVQWTDGNGNGSDHVTQTNITMTNLTAGVQYEITVTAVTDDGRAEGQSTTVSQYTRK